MSRVSVTSSGAQAQGESTSPAISADGSAIVFASVADNLTATDAGGLGNIYLRDRPTSQTIRVSHALDGSAPNGYSDFPHDLGRWQPDRVCFHRPTTWSATMPNRYTVFLYDRQQNTISCLSVSTLGSAADSLSTNPAPLC